MAKLILISWRDIPAQVIAKQGRETAKAPLSQRFQEAVDRAAMRAGNVSNAWRSLNVMRFVATRGGASAFGRAMIGAAIAFLGPRCTSMSE